MPRRQAGNLFNIVLLLAAAAALSACSHAEAVVTQPAPDITGSTTRPSAAASSAPTVAAAPAAPMTREKASTDCWMKYEKEGRGRSLDQRLPLVEKCTAEKLKTGR